MSKSNLYAELINTAKPSGDHKLGCLRNYRLGSHWGSNSNWLAQYQPGDHIISFECAVVAAFVHTTGNSITDASSGVSISRNDIKLTPEELKTISDFHEIGRRIAGQVFQRERGRVAAFSEVIRNRAAEQGMTFK